MELVTGSERQHKRFKASLGAGGTAAEREFERLYLESYPLVYNYVRARMGNAEDAEDIVAESFMNAARSFSSFDPSRAKFSTWVVTIARNNMISHYRKARLTVALDDAPQDAFAEEGDQNAVDDTMLVDQLLKCLDFEERDLVLMKYLDGKRNVDIAEELGMSASTVATKLSRALAKMREAYGTGHYPKGPSSEV